MSVMVVQKSARPTIGVVAPITNPLSTSYYSYLAFVDSWCKVADQVIIVDGGSNDGSVETLYRWTGAPPNLKVLSTEQTTWGAGVNWHLFQLTIDYNEAFALLDTDWVFPTGADHVVDVRTAGRLREELAELKDIAVVTHYRNKAGGGIRRKIDAQCAAVNFRLLRSRGIEPKHGLDLDTNIVSDWPLAPECKSSLLDPLTGVAKTIYAGRGIPIEGRGTLSLELTSYGHFFFDFEVCLSKLRRWNRASARFMGWRPSRDWELRLRSSLGQCSGHYDRDTVLSWDHPAEAQRVVAEFYRPGMLGGATGRRLVKPAPLGKGLRKLLGMERHLHTRLLRAAGYRGLRDFHKWVAAAGAAGEPVDVRAVYELQNRKLPEWARA